eukprot:8484109-Heterocapsa_arctica.AAC.1
MGPRPLSAQERAQAWAHLGIQRATGNSKRGLDHLLQPGLGKEEHVRLCPCHPPTSRGRRKTSICASQPTPWRSGGRSSRAGDASRRHC